MGATGPIELPYTYYGSVGLIRDNLVSEPILEDDGRYTAKFKNGIVLKFDASSEFASGLVNLDDSGKLILRNGYLISVFGSDKDDNIQLLNSRQCNVNMDGGGSDKLEILNENGYGFNTVAQDENDVTALKKPAVYKKILGFIPFKLDGGFLRVTGEDVFTDYEKFQSPEL